MLSDSWTFLLKQLPPERYGQLMVVTTGAIEICVQAIIVMEGECLVFKGRLAGSQEAGRIFYVPYDRIDFIGLIREVSEDDVRSWHIIEPPETTAETNGQSEPHADENAGAKPGARTALPNRAALLERIRSRSHSGNSPRPPSDE